MFRSYMEWTLGGTGKEPGNRHPKIGSGTMIGAGASILGNITVGESCRLVLAVLLKDVPDNSVAGIPAKDLGEQGVNCLQSLWNKNFEVK